MSITRFGIAASCSVALLAQCACSSRYGSNYNDCLIGAKGSSSQIIEEACSRHYEKKASIPLRIDDERAQQYGHLVHGITVITTNTTEALVTEVRLSFSGYRDFEMKGPLRSQGTWVYNLHLRPNEQTTFNAELPQDFMSHDVRSIDIDVVATKTIPLAR